MVHNCAHVQSMLTVILVACDAVALTFVAFNNIKYVVRFDINTDFLVNRVSVPVKVGLVIRNCNSMNSITKKNK